MKDFYFLMVLQQIIRIRKSPQDNTITGWCLNSSSIPYLLIVVTHTRDSNLSKKRACGSGGRLVWGMHRVKLYKSWPSSQLGITTCQHSDIDRPGSMGTPTSIKYQSLPFTIKDYKVTLSSHFISHYSSACTQTELAFVNIVMGNPS